MTCGQGWAKGVLAVTVPHVVVGQAVLHSGLLGNSLGFERKGSWAQRLAQKQPCKADSLCKSLMSHHGDAASNLPAQHMDSKKALLSFPH